MAVVKGIMMSYEDPTQVVVIEENRRRRGALPWIAGGAVIALLASGGTFALWRASANFTGGQVIAGDLDLTGCTDLKWYDISPDRADNIAGVTGYWTLNSTPGTPIPGVHGTVPASGTEGTGPTHYTWHDTNGVDLVTQIRGINFSSSVLLNAAPGKLAADGTIRALAAKASAYDGLTGASHTAADYPIRYTDYLNGGKLDAHEILNIATWRMVPGDTVLATCGDDTIVSLEGDNLVAKLTLVDEFGQPIDFGNLETWDGVISGGETFVAREPIVVSGDSLGYFGAPGTAAAGQQNGVLHEGVTELHAQSAVISTGPAPFTFTLANDDTTTAPVAATGKLLDLRKDLSTFNSGTGVFTAATGRASLGQAYVYPMFVIHFIDDGIPNTWVDAVGTCSGGTWVGTSDPVTTESACSTGGGDTWVVDTAGHWDSDYQYHTGFLCSGGTYNDQWVSAAQCTTGGGTPGTTEAQIGDATDTLNNRYLAGATLATLAKGRLVLEQVRTGAGAFN